MRLVIVDDKDGTYYPTKCGFYFLPNQPQDIIAALQSLQEKFMQLKSTRAEKKRPSEGTAAKDSKWQKKPVRNLPLADDNSDEAASL